MRSALFTIAGGLGLSMGVAFLTTGSVREHPLLKVPQLNFNLPEMSTGTSLCSHMSLLLLVNPTGMHPLLKVLFTASSE